MIRRRCSGECDSSNNLCHQDIKRVRSGPSDTPSPQYISASSQYVQTHIPNNPMSQPRAHRSMQIQSMPRSSIQTKVTSHSRIFNTAKTTTTTQNVTNQTGIISEARTRSTVQNPVTPTHCVRNHATRFETTENRNMPQCTKYSQLPQSIMQNEVVTKYTLPSHSIPSSTIESPLKSIHRTSTQTMQRDPKIHIDLSHKVEKRYPNLQNHTMQSASMEHQAMMQSTMGNQRISNLHMRNPNVKNEPITESSNESQARKVRTLQDSNMKNQTMPPPAEQNDAMTNPSVQKEANMTSESAIQNQKIENSTVQSPAMRNQDMTQSAMQNQAMPNLTVQSLATSQSTVQNQAMANITVLNSSMHSQSMQNQAMANGVLQNPTVQKCGRTSSAANRNQQTGRSAPNLEWDPLPEITCPSTSRYWVLYMENVRKDKELRRQRLAQKREENIDDFLRRFPVE